MGFDVAVKPLADGGLAVTVLNKGPVSASYALPLAWLGVAQTPCALATTDVWSGEGRSLEAQGALKGEIAAHDTMMARVAPAKCLGWTPAGQVAAAQSAFARAPLCLQAGDKGGVTVESCNSRASQQWRMEPGGHIALTEGGGCLSMTAGKAAVEPCRAGAPRQTFAYHLSGALTAGRELCLAVKTGKVGNGGLIGQQGAVVRGERCRTFAPEQTFSAPHRGAPPT